MCGRRPIRDRGYRTWVGNPSFGMSQFWHEVYRSSARQIGTVNECLTLAESIEREFARQLATRALLLEDLEHYSLT